MKRNIDFSNIGMTVQELSSLIDQRVFSERDRFLLKRKFLDGKTFEFVAEECEISTQRAKKIVEKYRAMLFEK